MMGTVVLWAMALACGTAEGDSSGDDTGACDKDYYSEGYDDCAACYDKVTVKGDAVCVDAYSKGWDDCQADKADAKCFKK
jgi:hypothetical protein